MTHTEDIYSSTLNMTVKAGDATGMSAVVTTETKEGITIVSECIGKVYAETDCDKNEWTVIGEPETTVTVQRPATVELTCADIVNRIPDVINARPGFVPTSQMPEPTYIPEGYCKRIVINGIIANTVILYLRPHSTGTGGYPNYQGDELLALGRYDFSYRIPHVPEGDYEIRFGYSVSGLRAITQFYFDGNVCGIPVDMGLGSDKPLIGWEEDKESAEENKELDKTMRNRFYMKGPASCHLDKDGNSMRDSGLALRKIIGTYRLDKGDHWIRFKNVTDDIMRGTDYVQFNQDYLEIVPTNIINNPAKPEDQY